MDALAAFPARVLCIGAHPEDIDVHASGAVARLVARGAEVAYLLCTTGNRGTADREVSMEAIGERRQHEQEQAAGVLGVQQLRFLGYPDGDLRFHLEALREDLVHTIRELKPDAIITHDPYPGDGGHDACAIYPDHVTVGQTSFDAAFLCAGSHLHYPLQLEAGLEPHSVQKLFLIMSGSPSAFVDVSEVWEKRVEAISCHRSQSRHRSENQELLWTIARERGRISGFRLAEAFRVLLPG